MKCVGQSIPVPTPPTHDGLVVNLPLGKWLQTFARIRIASKADDFPALFFPMTAEKLENSIRLSWKPLKLLSCKEVSISKSFNLRVQPERSNLAVEAWFRG
jgi:hypothetical protein